MRYVGEDVGIWSRLGSAISYLTAGWGGIIVLVILYFAKKIPSKFFTFNVYQSIIIAFTIFVIGMGWKILYSIFTHIPIIKGLFTRIDDLFFKPVLISCSIPELFIRVLILYCVIFCLIGKFPVIYKVSSLIKR